MGGKIQISQDVVINVMLLQGLCVFMVLGAILFFYKIYKLYNK